MIALRDLFNSSELNTCIEELDSATYVFTLNITDDNCMSFDFVDSAAFGLDLLQPCKVSIGDIPPGYTEVSFYNDGINNCYRAAFVPPPNGADLLLQVNGDDNADQSLLNLLSGSNISIVDNGDGSVTISATPGPIGIDSINGDNSVAQFLIEGTGISIVDDGAGGHIISAIGGASNVPVGQSLFVSDITGDDSTAVRGRFDLMYQTLEAAILDAQNGDTVYVYPGSYTLSGEIDTPAFNNFRIHAYNGAVITGFPQLNMFNVQGGLILTGDGEFISQGINIGAYAAFSINPIVPGDVSIECKKITGSDHGVVITGGLSTKNVDINAKQGIFGASTGIKYDGSHTVNVRCDVAGNIAIENNGNGPFRLRDAKRLTSAASNPAYAQLSLGNGEAYGTIFIAGPGATYALTTNTSSNFKLYGACAANKPADPNITFLVNSPLLVDSNVS